MQSKTRLNILANFVGRSWSSLMTLVFVPLYIKFLGVEAYGLIGFFVTLKAVISLLDLGFSTTLNRELARFSVDEAEAGELADTARTIEALYWALALVILILTSALAPLLAGHWINAQSLAPRAVSDAVRLMGLVITFSFPFGLYSGGLMGLQRQVLVNAINVVLGTLRGAGAVLVLWLVSPTVEAFFVWQAAVAVLETAVTMICLWRVLPGGFLSARFRVRILRRVGRFAAGMTGIGISTILLTQIDKIVLIKLLPLKTFGYYTLAVTVGSGVQSLLVYPVSNAVFPRLSQLVKVNEGSALAGFYHQACQLISLLIVPIGLTVVLFAREVLFLWTRDAAVAANAHLILSVVMTGYIFNSAVIIPYMLQLAGGWIRLTLAYNLICVAALLPGLYLGVKFFGVIGGAAIIVVQNACYILFVIPRMHRLLLPEEKKRWYVHDFGLPMAAGLAGGMGLWLAAGRLPLPAVVKIAIVLTGIGISVLLAGDRIKSLLRTYLGTRGPVKANVSDPHPTPDNRHPKA